MSEVKITTQEKLDDGWSFTVQTPAGTEHTVTVSKDYHQELTSGEITPEELVRKSFTFLLDNEPASAVLSAFELEDIETYFSDYKKNISERFS
jgi:hypothetical protein